MRLGDASWGGKTSLRRKASGKIGGVRISLQVTGILEGRPFRRLGNRQKDTRKVGGDLSKTLHQRLFIISGGELWMDRVMGGSPSMGKAS